MRYTSDVTVSREGGGGGQGLPRGVRAAGAST